MNLLNVVRTDSFGPRKGGTPLMVEFRVNPETSPFLVSSTKSFVWVAPRADRIRSAVRLLGEGGLDDVFREMVHTIAEAGVEGKWGNVHPFTRAGLEAARAHLSYYGLDDTVLVAHPSTDVTIFDSVEVVRASWVPEGWVLVLSEDREFVGFLVTTNDRYLAVVHNSSRAVAVVRP
jgi:hypothetical protein